MQIKPHFKEYTEMSRTPLCNDGLGKSYSLVEYIGILNNGTTEKGVAVLSDELKVYASKATAYNEILHFDMDNMEKLYSHHKDSNALCINYLVLRELNGYRLYPVYAGKNGYFENGINIYIHIEKI